MVFRILTVLALTITTSAMAEVSNKPLSNWESTTHLGFAVTDQSSTSFEGVMGSMGFLDVSRIIRDGVSLGLRSVFMGGEQSGSSYYRISAGPLVTIEPMDNWLFQASIGSFRESAAHGSGGDLYRSRGTFTMLGWERAFPILPRVTVLWGGFIAFHNGTVDALALNSPQHNRGRSKGVEIALRMSL